MAFNTGAALLDALVLSTAEREPTYGYRITQQVRQIMMVSESTLYQEFAGRNRRYYRLTPSGAETLAKLRAEWVEYRQAIDAMLLNEGDAQ